MRIIARNAVSYGAEEYTLLFKAAAWVGPAAGGVARFEAAFSRLVGDTCAVAAPSATAGLTAILRAFGFKTPGEVVVPAYGHPSVMAAVAGAGLTPVCADIDLDGYTVSPWEVERAITRETRAIIVAHVFGTPADLDPLLSIARARRLPLVADCAHALGAKYDGRQAGTIEDAGVFSFGTGKAVCCLRGGMVVCRDGDLARRVRREVRTLTTPARSPLTFVPQLANAVLSTGWIYKSLIFPPLYLLSRHDRAWLDDRFTGRAGDPAGDGGQHRGYRESGEFTDLQAALGIVQIGRLESHNRARVEAARRLIDGIANPALALPRELPRRESCFLCVPMRCRDATDAARQLMRRGIDTRPDYLSYFGSRHDLRNRIVYLPNHPGLSNTDLDAIIEAVNEIR